MVPSLREARDLIAAAATVYDGSKGRLAALSRSLPYHSSADGRWMRGALVELRDDWTPPNNYDLTHLGSVKYGVCVVAAAVPVAIAYVLVSPWPLLVVVPAFYLVEAQWVFLYPVALDGSEHPFEAARSLTRRAGGTLRVAANVVVLATVMLFGGLTGHGFVRSWCLGCLAVLIWYERVRAGEAAPA